MMPLGDGLDLNPGEFNSRACYFSDRSSLFGKVMRSGLLLCFGLVLAASVPAQDSGPEPLPEPVSNNAVAGLKIHGQLELFSLMGIGPKKTWDAVTTDANAINASSGKVEPIHPVPGTTGRIAAMAVGAAGRIFLFGGYVVSQAGGTAIPDVNIYDPEHDLWLRGADIPVALADSVIGVYRDRYIYLIGGRSKAGPVSDVYVYDVDKARWSKATNLAGAAVFGNAGAIVDDTIVYVDGARKDAATGFAASDECWKGKIDHHDPTKIAWSKLPAHPGAARFRVAAGGSEKDEMIYFSGGSDHPYDYNGIGYDGKPAEPSPLTFGFNLKSGKWQTINDKTANPTMDHRGLLVTHDNLVILGGMEAGQKVTAQISVIPKQGGGK